MLWVSTGSLALKLLFSYRMSYVGFQGISPAIHPNENWTGNNNEVWSYSSQLLGNGRSLWPMFAKCCGNVCSEITTEHVTPSQPVTFPTTTTPMTTTSSGCVTPSRCFNLMSVLFVCLRFNTNKKCMAFSVYIPN